MRHVLTAVTIVAIAGGSAYAQDVAATNPYTTAVHEQFRQIHGFVVKAAEKIGQELYSFQPTPEVRTFAQLFGHIADAEVSICRMTAGGTPDFGVREKKTAKSDLLAALKEAETECNATFAKVTDASGTAAISMFGMSMPKLNALTFNNSHSWEHYGNLVTYMRLKGIVPPTSERRRTSSGQ